MVYPVRSHRCGGNSDSIADIVTTNYEKSAEVIVPKKIFFGKDRTIGVLETKEEEVMQPCS